MSFQQTPQIILPHLNWSLARLKEAIEKENTEYYRGVALHRFSLTYEVTLKVIRAFAIQEGAVLSTDNEHFQWADEKKWLEKKSDWVKVTKNYKKVKNLPKEMSTNDIYNELQDYYALLYDIVESLNLSLSKKI
jgi:hypothetical protein